MGTLLTLATLRGRTAYLSTKNLLLKKNSLSKECRGVWTTKPKIRFKSTN